MENQTDIVDQNPRQIGNDSVGQPELKPEYSKTKKFIYAGIILVSFVIIGLGGYYLGKYSIQTKYEVQDQPIPSLAVSPTGSVISWTDYTFRPIQLNLSVPSELDVHTIEPNPGKDFTAYIQNYPFNAPVPTENAYQLYIIWQKTPTLTQSSFQQLKNDLDTDSIEDTTIAGYPAIKGQIKGERNRYVTHILRNNTKISLFTSEPTLMNKERTNQILSTFEFSDPISGLTPTPLKADVLRFTLPEGWRIAKDTSGTLEFGYDPAKYSVSEIMDKRIDLKNLADGRYGGMVRITDYDGGSRHVFLLETSGAGNYFDKSDAYFEKNYLYNGRSCLLISGAYVSASLDSWMMCDVGGGKAVFINAQGGTNVTSLMSSVNVLK